MILDTRTLVEIQHEAVIDRIIQCGVHIARAADSLGISETTMHGKVKSYGLRIKKIDGKKTIVLKSNSELNIQYIKRSGMDKKVII